MRQVISFEKNGSIVTTVNLRTEKRNRLERGDNLFAVASKTVGNLEVNIEKPRCIVDRRHVCSGGRRRTAIVIGRRAATAAVAIGGDDRMRRFGYGGANRVVRLSSGGSYRRESSCWFFRSTVARAMYITHIRSPN